MPKRISKTKPAKTRGRKDSNQTAFSVVQKVIQNTEEEPALDRSTISAVMAALGRIGGKKGGKRRMKTMTPEERSEAAYKAAQARWAKRKK
jgi:hypothetical protein